MSKFCSNCGTQLKENVKFCAGCGQASAQEQAEQPVQQFQPQEPQPHTQDAPKKKKTKLLIIIGGGAAVILAAVLAFTNVFGLFGGNGNDPGNAIEADVNGGENSNGSDNEIAYEIFGDGNLIKAPQRLQSKSSPDDGISTAALVGTWQGYRNSFTTDWGFSDDGWFYKNVMHTRSNMRSIYHPGYYSGDYYYYGRWEWIYDPPTYTYFDTIMGKYEVRGGVIVFSQVVSTSRTNFFEDWYHAETRTVDMESLHKNARPTDINTNEFEFINKDRVRFRNESDDIDLFWNLKDDPHNVTVPTHEIPPVEWPSNALHPDMPKFTGQGRYREASLSYSGDEKNIKPEYKTVTVVIDKADALSGIDTYGRSLKSSGWWGEDYELKSDDTYLSFEARKGMFKLSVSNGRGSGTSADTIVIESTKYQEGVWPKAWLDATLTAPDNAVAVGPINIETGVDINVYETIIFDKVNDAGVGAYAEKLQRNGFKKPYFSGDDWDYMKYVRISGDLYLARIGVDKRMDSLTSFSYNLSYVEDGVWPESWTKAGLSPPESYDSIAGAIDKTNWDECMSEYSSDYVYVKYLGLDAKGVEAYFNKLKLSGFIPVIDWDGSETGELYSYLRIEERMIRVEISVMDNEDITELRYYFNCYEDGVWPSIWQYGGLPAPDKFDTIIGAIDLDEWKSDLSGEYGGTSYQYIKYLGMTAADASNYITKLKNAGFKPVKEWDGSDTDSLYNYLRIDGKLYRVQVEQKENSELTEFYYMFNSYEDGVWPAIWQSGGLPMPDGGVTVAGKIDLDEWKNDLSDEYSDTSNQYIKYLGMTETDASNYITKLKNAGFKAVKDWDGSDTNVLCHYLRIDGKLYRVQVEQRENNELIEYLYTFSYYEDGEWPSQWTSAGIPAPTFTAMPGKIDMAEFDESMSDYGSYHENIKLLGANLSNYKALLKNNGFTEPEYSWSDTWELEKRVQLGGKRVVVTIRDTGNQEIPEISISFNSEYE